MLLPVVQHGHWSWYLGGLRSARHQELHNGKKRFNLGSCKFYDYFYAASGRGQIRSRGGSTAKNRMGEGRGRVSVRGSFFMQKKKELSSLFMISSSSKFYLQLNDYQAIFSRCCMQSLFYYYYLSWLMETELLF